MLVNPWFIFIECYRYILILLFLRFFFVASNKSDWEESKIQMGLIFKACIFSQQHKGYTVTHCFFVPSCFCIMPFFFPKNFHPAPGWSCLREGVKEEASSRLTSRMTLGEATKREFRLGQLLFFQLWNRVAECACWLKSWKKITRWFVIFTVFTCIDQTIFFFSANFDDFEAVWRIMEFWCFMLT